MPPGMPERLLAWPGSRGVTSGEQSSSNASSFDGFIITFASFF
jgi:hypothetical protein